jgi:hypothetical protein
MDKPKAPLIKVITETGVRLCWKEIEGHTGMCKKAMGHKGQCLAKLSWWRFLLREFGWK